jgi:hypothetical protein
VRQQQRCVPFLAIKLILEHGTPRKKPGHAFEYRILQRDKRELISDLGLNRQVMDKIMAKRVLVSREGLIITVYNSYK